MTHLLFRQQMEAIDKSVLQLIAQRLRLMDDIRLMNPVLLNEQSLKEVRDLWITQSEELGLPRHVSLALLSSILSTSRLNVPPKRETKDDFSEETVYTDGA